ncbi:Ankyrin repeat family protein [Melia azedarach]|uniref:Ankyrin repeat family protein n=2 Tax=Melia azedarach TaxID=155640 RepID=A0ACC1WU35_MELAZ|nr:Ankyrin repeat family protein [Melia azedarach]KAJ4702505.1 Ankyrin repeat family protein [Melia azedarach]
MKRENIHTMEQLAEKQTKLMETLVEQLAEKQQKLLETLVEQQREVVKLIKEIVPKKNETETRPVDEDMGDGNHAENEAHLFDEDMRKLPEQERIRRLKLYRAALNGDREEARRIQGKCEEKIGVLKISDIGETALHIAAEAKQIGFVKELVNPMDEDDLKKQNDHGQTALFYAAMYGKVELAQEVMKNKNNIAMIPDNDGTLPIHVAAWIGHKEMVDFLYQKTRHLLEEDSKAELFVSCIESGLYDIASQMLTDYPNLATAEDTDNETALDVLARKNLKFSNLVNQNQQGIIKKCFNLVLGAKSVETEKLKAVQLVERIWKIAISSSTDEISKLSVDLIFDAAERGNDEFLSFLIHEYPDILWKSNENDYTIFHIAVKNRQIDVFKLIYETNSLRNMLSTMTDEKDNNILHLAGILAPSDRLNIVSGAALQMQRELLWFKEVENFVYPWAAEVENKEGFTPRALFTKEHENLRENGEKWMKETAESCMIVAALIATVAFAAAITVPGGNIQDKGFPVFLEKASFKIFAISDAISLVFSTASISTFLSILTSRYTEEDFLLVLPRKLRTGLVTLFLSMAAMMVVFSTTYFLFFNDRNSWIAILVTLIASTPAIMFVWQHFQLFYDVLRLTRDSDSLFKRGKSVFHKKEETSDQSQERKISSAQVTLFYNV